jgi:hypothetical protein
LTVGKRHALVDLRLFPGGKFAIVKRPSEVDMRIPDLVLKSVVFIGEAVDETNGDLLGTGFFVSIPLAVEPHRVLFLVTAKHVAEDLQNRDLHIAVNKRGGGVIGLRLQTQKWWFHPTDKTADVAITPVNVDVKVLDLVSIPIEKSVTAEMIRGDEIGVGDETFMTGLFTPAPGQSRNMPIVRHGNVAMLPGEQIQTELGFADVYLVEARSIGGLSGSPVFVRETIAMNVSGEGEEERWMAGLGNMYFLGLMHGHWDIKESEMNSPKITHDQKRGVNLGIGIVVPAEKIMDTINHPELREMRDALEEKLRKPSHVPGMDSARKPKPSEEPFTKEQFEAALKKVSRKIEPER